MAAANSYPHLLRNPTQEHSYDEEDDDDDGDDDSNEMEYDMDDIDGVLAEERKRDSKLTMDREEVLQSLGYHANRVSLTDLQSFI